MVTDDRHGSWRPRLWAPAADRVELVRGDERVEMSPLAEGREGYHRTKPGDPARDGWWGLPDEAEGLAPGTDYAFSLDGGEPRPDPRSAWQPDGVHGPSRVVDPQSFDWTDQAWAGFDLGAAVLYELHVGTFTEEGTFDAAVERLDHLVELGVTAVEVMPVNAFPGEHGWGYDGVNWYAVQDSYGGPHGLQRFVDACHAHGLGVVLDVVYNHLGPDGNHLAEFGPWFTDRYGTPWGEAVNLDGAESDHVRRHIIDNALWWLVLYHVDGLRLDAVHALFDESAVHLLEQLATEVAALAEHHGRPYHLIAESELNAPRVFTPRARGGYGLDASWSDDLHHAVHTMVTGERDGYYVDFEGEVDVAHALEHGWVYDGRWSAFRRRSHGRPLPDDLPGTRLLGYVQNHDQVGNRARGERLSHLVADPGLLATAAAVLLTAPQVPMLFMGEEWGASTPFPYFTDHQDPALQDAVREGRRSEFAAFGWAPEDVLDPQDPATFASAKLRWDERTAAGHAELLGWYRDLIALRHAVPALTDGDRGAVRATGNRGWLLVERGPVLIAASTADSTQDVLVPEVPGSLLLQWPQDTGPPRLGTSITLPPFGVQVYGDDQAREQWEAARAAH